MAGGAGGGAGPLAAGGGGRWQTPFSDTPSMSSPTPPTQPPLPSGWWCWRGAWGRPSGAGGRRGGRARRCASTLAEAQCGGPSDASEQEREAPKTRDRTLFVLILDKTPESPQKYPDFGLKNNENCDVFEAQKTWGISIYTKKTPGENHKKIVLCFFLKSEEPQFFWTELVKKKCKEAKKVQQQDPVGGFQQRNQK